jgi:hypothetical protein
MPTLLLYQGSLVGPAGNNEKQGGSFLPQVIQSMYGALHESREGEGKRRGARTDRQSQNGRKTWRNLRWKSQVSHTILQLRPTRLRAGLCNASLPPLSDYCSSPADNSSGWRRKILPESPW